MLNDENKAQYKYDVVNHPSYFYPYYLHRNIFYIQGGKYVAFNVSG